MAFYMNNVTGSHTEKTSHGEPAIYSQHDQHIRKSLSGRLYKIHEIRNHTKNERGCKNQGLIAWVELARGVFARVLAKYKKLDLMVRVQ